MAMHRRLAKEIPVLRRMTLQSDGMTVEDGSESSGCMAAAVGSTTPAYATKSRGGYGGKGPPGNADAISFVALLAGPRDSPYEGGVFRLRITIPPNYPMDPPKMQFVTRLFHPNVGSGHTPGAICLDILRKEAWSPALTIERTLLSIASLLADPNPNSPMDSEAARLFTRDRPEYDRRVRDFVAKFARPDFVRSGQGGQGSGWAGDDGKAEDQKPQDDSEKAATTAASGKAAATAAGEKVVNKTEAVVPPAATKPATSLRQELAEVVIDLDDSDDDTAAETATRPAKKART
eukprot:TRINITY_DN39460_c0_g1_i1.p1 TRINITY_DN39460_c0_g1~~TRINITY_DN39460_c0_g1_i1.p1  ORF type:complete len:291 (+),score=77.14 TRINITY_DN39460_c0_g1_i1:138-1010(+)